MAFVQRERSGQDPTVRVEPGDAVGGEPGDVPGRAGDPALVVLDGEVVAAEAAGDARA